MPLAVEAVSDRRDRWEPNPQEGSALADLPRLHNWLRQTDWNDLEAGKRLPWSSDTSMLLNMGPVHPSTHGVLRVGLETEGEEILSSAVSIGYLHTGIEKTAESLTFVQVPTALTRMDYVSPFFTETVFALAVETLLQVEAPPRATCIRTILCELNRMSSHFVALATGGFEMGAESSMFYGTREREEILRFFESVTGLRMNHNFIRPGGVAADLPDGWRQRLLDMLTGIESRMPGFDELLSRQPVFRNRLQGVASLSAQEALALSATGPVLRASGVPWDLRRDQPYLNYAEVEFDILVGEYGDAFDRFAIRLHEVSESIHIVRQLVDLLPSGDYRIQDRKVTPPPRIRINDSMEALIHHFKLFTEGIKVPEGEVYVAVESPRGELGCQLVSDGSGKPLRVHIKAPSFANLQTLPSMLPGSTIADVIAAISSIDPVMGEVDR